MARNHWLFKTEPDCFSIDHLAKEENQTAAWDGVRNYQVRNMLRDDIKKGDLVLFYHSSQAPIGVAGICEVVKSGYPDHTAWDPDSDHYDPKASPDNPRWFMVDVQLKTKFHEVLRLKTLKETPGLEDMVVTRQGNRLSITPVTADEFKIVKRLAGVR